MKRKWLLWLPFAIGLALLAVFWLGLRRPDDHVIASHVVGQPLPEFTAPPAFPGRQQGMTTADYRDGKPRLLNVFASWCVPCIAEIPELMKLKARGVEIDGLAIHDAPADIDAFLSRNGNPYARIGLDNQSRAQLAMGSSGAPETFVIDGQGRIVHQHIGVVSDRDIPEILGKLGMKP